MNSLNKAQTNGFSLIELMISMTIGLILILVAIQIFISSQKTYAVISALSNIQDNGRYALNFMTHSIRQAGFAAECLTPLISHVQQTKEDYSINNYNFSPPILGWTKKKPYSLSFQNTMQEGTDAITTKYADDMQTFLGTESSSTGIKTTRSTKNYDKKIVILSNATNCDLFFSSSNKPLWFQNILKEPEHSAQSFTENYKGMFSAFTFNSVSYFIRESTSTNSMPTLYRKVHSFNAYSEELVSGVVDMNITYGLDTNNDQQVDVYVNSDSKELQSDTLEAWNKIISVRLFLLVLSSKPNVLETSKIIKSFPSKGKSKENDLTKYYEDGSILIKNRRAAQVFSTTVAIRNKLL